MSHFWKTVFQPLANRNFTSKKVSAVYHALEYTPYIFIVIILTVYIDIRFMVLLPLLALIGTVEFLLLDRFKDRSTWKLFWHNFYTENGAEKNSEYSVMNKLERNPTEENRKALETHLLDKQ